MPDRPNPVIDDLGLSPAASTLVTARYLRRDATGVVCETPGQMMDRVAFHVAAAEDLHHPRSSRETGTVAVTDARSDRSVRIRSPATE